MSNEFLAVSDLSVSYHARRLGAARNNFSEGVVKDISFHVEHGEVFGLIGESGCGKTTVAKAISGLVPYQGSIALDGKELSQIPRKSRSSEVQMIFQNPYNSLNPSMRIKSILAEPLKIHGIAKSKEQRQALTDNMLNTIGLDSSYRNRFVRELSGGQRQRISIGCALMLSPKLLIADEVLSALDVSVQSNILNMLTQLNQDLGVTILFISHDINVVAYFCQRIAVMYAGEIVEIGNSLDVYYSPIHPYTKTLIQSIPKLNGLPQRDTAILHDVPERKSEGCAYSRYCSQFSNKCMAASIPLGRAENNRYIKCVQHQHYTNGVYA